MQLFILAADAPQRPAIAGKCKRSAATDTLVLIPLIIHLQVYADFHFSWGKLKVNKHFGKKRGHFSRQQQGVMYLKNQMFLTERPQVTPPPQCLKLNGSL